MPRLPLFPAAQHLRSICSQALLMLLMLTALCSCKDSAPAPDAPSVPDTSPINTPFTSIPDELVGIWFAKDNKTPLTLNWAQGTVMGELGFRDFRTMVFTKDGQNAVEYSTFSVDLGSEVVQRFYRFTGTLEYKPNASPRSLTFHAQSGTMRVFRSGVSGYQETPIARADVQAHHSVWQNPNATSSTTATNYLTCQYLNGGIPVSAEYQQVSTTSPAAPNLPTTTPPAGPSVKIGNLYYATAVIGDLEWTTVNYAGPGGIKDADKPQYGTFVNRADLDNVPVPAGWRLPTRQDFEKLLASQNVVLEPWNMTADDLPTTRALGPLQATTGWRRVDSWATNATGFNALPANIRVLNATANPQGEGSNCVLWTADRDASGQPLSFKIVQNTLTTYASVVAYPAASTATAPHIPVRFVRDK